MSASQINQYMFQAVTASGGRKLGIRAAPDESALAEALRRLHALPLTGRTFDAIGAARDYVRRIEGGDEDRIRDFLQKIENGPRPPNLCCCHNDLVVGNIINTPETRFLDWEYACDNDPLFDLATIVAHHEMSDGQANYLLDAYFGGNGVRWRMQLDQQIGLYRALLWLWSGLAPVHGRPKS